MWIASFMLLSPPVVLISILSSIRTTSVPIWNESVKEKNTMLHFRSITKSFILFATCILVVLQHLVMAVYSSSTPSCCFLSSSIDTTPISTTTTMFNQSGINTRRKFWIKSSSAHSTCKHDLTSNSSIKKRRFIDLFCYNQSEIHDDASFEIKKGMNRILLGRRKMIKGVVAGMMSTFFLNNQGGDDSIIAHAAQSDIVEMMDSNGSNEANKSSSTSTSQTSNNNANNNKPYAPNEALLPAVRVKLSIDDAIKLIENHDNSSIEQRLDCMTTLQKLLLQPQNYIQSSLQLQGVPNQPAKQYLESYKPMNGDLPFQLYLIKNGDVSTWKDLKRKEKEQEKTNEIRAAFNAYTDVLSFSGNSYMLNVDSKTKSNMIREDKLPELKQVITSDMGMRYLYRNQILNAMDEVKAELQYQVTLMDGKDNDTDDIVDLSELLRLLKLAQIACDKWFGLINEADVDLALTTVLDERKVGL